MSRGQRAHDEGEDEEPELEFGHAEGAKGNPDHSTHPAHLVGLYIPDLSNASGWDYHHIDPQGPAGKPERRPVGFRPR